MGIEEGLSAFAGVSYNKENQGGSNGVACSFSAGIGGYGEGGANWNSPSGYGEGGVVFGQSGGCAVMQTWSLQLW